MISAKFTILAKNVYIDSLTNQLSINGVIEEMQAPSMPAILQEASLVALFEKGEDEQKNIDAIIEVKLNGKIIGKQEFEIDFLGFTRNRTILKIPDLNVNEFGLLKFDFVVNRKIVGTYSAKIVQSKKISEIEGSTKKEKSLNSKSKRSVKKKQ